MQNAWRPTKNTLPGVFLFSLDLLDTVHRPWENTIVTGHWILDRQAHRKHTATLLFDNSGGTFSASVANLCRVRVSQYKWFTKPESESRLYRIVMTILSFDGHFTSLCSQERRHQYNIQKVR